MLSFWGKKRKDAFFQDNISFNQNFNIFIVCMWTAWCTKLKNKKHTQKLGKFGEISHFRKLFTDEPRHDKTNKVTVRPAKNQISLGIPPSLIRVFAVRTRKAWVLSYSLSAQRRLWSDWADAGRTLILLVLSCRGSDFENHTRRQADKKHASFWTLTTRIYPTEQIQSILQPDIATHFKHFWTECKILKF